jgi:hypothetical protein
VSDEHCKDCCCARSWKALGITEYTGLSIPEHIERLRAQLAKAQSVIHNEREMARRRLYPDPFKICSVYTRRGGLTYMLPIVKQWHEYPDVAIEVGWCDALRGGGEK